jgi:peptidoglycan glycosyltransferase
MPFTREIQRLILGFTIVFFLILVAAAYWAVDGADSILAREDNPRLFEAEASIVRGSIVDRFEEPLVTSAATTNGRAIRTYAAPSMNSVLGYYSLRYGVGGIESAYDTLLRGDITTDTEAEPDFGQYILRNWLHQPVRGGDVRLTLDLGIQQIVVDTIQDYTGAVVVMAVPSGEVLALASLPTYDPNNLDAQWDQLIQAPDNPFFNRAVQGRYQPGSALQPMFMTAALINGIPVDELQSGASQPVELDNVTLRCSQRPPADRLVLSEGLAFGCPAPFVSLFQQLGASPFEEIYDLYGISQHYTLPGFEQILPTAVVTEEPTNLSVDAVAFETAATLAPEPTMTLENILGQGSITVSPLDLAVVTASIVNEGNAPIPIILSGVRQPGEADFTPVNNSLPTIPITTANTSRRLQEMMRSATTLGAATRAARTNMNVGGHVGLAYSGENTYSWFNGYVITGSRQGIVISLVLENVDNPTEVAAIGGQILETAFNRPITSTTNTTNTTP